MRLKRAYCREVVFGLAFVGAMLVTGSIQPVRAQEPVVGATDPEALFTSPYPALNANKQVVLHIVRDLLEAGHWSDAPKYLTSRYIQHNPNVKSGLDAVTKAFAGRPMRPVPNNKSWQTKVVSVVAEGDLVIVATVRTMSYPGDANRSYTTTWFDMWRIKDNKADEHWDGATIPILPPVQRSTPVVVPPLPPLPGNP